MGSCNPAFAVVTKQFDINYFNEHRKGAIRTVIEDKRDVFVNLPTGCGKSLVFRALPFIFDCVGSQQENIVVMKTNSVKFCQRPHYDQTILKACHHDPR